MEFLSGLFFDSPMHSENREAKAPEVPDTYLEPEDEREYSISAVTTSLNSPAR